MALPAILMKVDCKESIRLVVWLLGNIFFSEMVQCTGDGWLGSQGFFFENFGEDWVMAQFVRRIVLMKPGNVLVD